MANSNLYHILQPGKTNGGNAHAWNLLQGDSLPWAYTPELVFTQTITWRDLRDATDVLQTDEMVVGGTIVAGDHSLIFANARTGATIATVTHTVHEDTITIGGTASDGNYDAIFDSVGVRARVVRDTTPATNDDIATELAAQITDLIPTSLAGIVDSAAAVGAVVTVVYEAGIDPQTISTAETTATGTIVATVAEDADAIAAALEALIETARATTLADYVDDESVATDTITVEYVEGVQVTLTADFPGTSTGTLTVLNVATIPIGADVGNLFPANVWVNGESGGAGHNVITAFAGITTITGELGGTFASGADADGLMTSTSIASTGFDSTIAAAEYVEHMEPAFTPTYTVTADETFANLTAGELQVLIPFSAPPTI